MGVFSDVQHKLHNYLLDSLSYWSYSVLWGLVLQGRFFLCFGRDRMKKGFKCGWPEHKEAGGRVKVEGYGLGKEGLQCIGI